MLLLLCLLEFQEILITPFSERGQIVKADGKVTKMIKRDAGAIRVLKSGMIRFDRG